MSFSVADAVNRMKNEKKPSLDFQATAKRPEPTLDEAREELATSISQIAHTVFSKRYGPLVGSVTKTTVETVLKNVETNADRARHDIRLVVDELIDRAFKK